MLFFFNDTATTEIYTLSLHDALPILERFQRLLVSAGRRPRRGRRESPAAARHRRRAAGREDIQPALLGDRKSTRLNSSHANTSYAVFCLKKTKYRPLPSPIRTHLRRA